MEKQKPPKVLLCDLGEVVVKIKVAACTQPIADLFGLKERQVQALMWGPRHDCNRHYAMLERGQIRWRTYYRYVTLLFMTAAERSRVPDGWSQAYFEELWQRVIDRPVHEVLAIMEALSRHLVIASASNTNKRHYRQMLASEDRVLRHIHEHTPSHEIGVRKGDDKYFPRILAKLGVEPHEAVYVDDVPEFTGEALRHGIRAITLFDHTPDDIAQLKHDLVSHGVPTAWLEEADAP